MNYVSFCRMYFSVTHIPISLMKKNEAIYSSIGEVCSVKAARYWETLLPHGNVRETRAAP